MVAWKSEKFEKPRKISPTPPGPRVATIARPWRVARADCDTHAPYAALQAYPRDAAAGWIGKVEILLERDIPVVKKKPQVYLRLQHATT